MTHQNRPQALEFTSSYSCEFKDGLMQIKSLPIARWVNCSTVHVGNMADSPYYLSLRLNSKSIFDDYMNIMEHLNKSIRQISWYEFLELKSVIENNGFLNPSKNNGIPPIFISRLGTGQHDGHHRLAILAYVYGLDSYVRNRGGFIEFFESDNIQ